MVEFEWDAVKASANLAKHKVSFQAARLVLRDAHALEQPQFGGNPPEERYVTTGMANGILLTVVYTERRERIRIISARKATTHEEKGYYRSKGRE